MTEYTEPAAVHVARSWNELGANVTFDDADQILRNLGRGSLRELYCNALGQSVSIKRNRLQRRELRRETPDRRR